MLEQIRLACARLAKPVRQFSQKITRSVEQRQRQAALNEHEAERLDRIRNPSKYRGR
jgi:hypothetical protein